MCIFEKVTDKIMNQLEDIKVTYYIFVGKIDCNISVTSDPPVTVEGNDVYNLKGTIDHRISPHEIST